MLDPASRVGSALWRAPGDKPKAGYCPGALGQGPQLCWWDLRVLAGPTWDRLPGRLPCRWARVCVPSPAGPAATTSGPWDSVAFSSQSRRPAQGSTPEKAPSSSPHYPPTQLCESPSTLPGGRLTGSYWAADASVYTRHILGTCARAQVRRRMALESPGQSSAHISLSLDSSDVS